MGNNICFTLLLVCVCVGGLMCILMFILIRKASLMHSSILEYAPSPNPALNSSDFHPGATAGNEYTGTADSVRVDLNNDTQEFMPEDEKEEYRIPDETLGLIYRRIEEYFKNEQPFLDPNITISDVSRTLFTNRSYVSRSIRKYADKNFCQYVNYHRIKYCVDILSSDTSLKVIELAHLSGFNSLATFNISFRTYMSQSAGEWLRRNRTRENLS